MGVAPQGTRSRSKYNERIFLLLTVGICGVNLGGFVLLCRADCFPDDLVGERLILRVNVAFPDE